MTITLIDVLLAYTAYIVLGCAVLATVDRRGELLHWVSTAPHWSLREIAVHLWPLLVWFYLFGHAQILPKPAPTGPKTDTPAATEKS